MEREWEGGGERGRGREGGVERGRVDIQGTVFYD